MCLVVLVKMLLPVHVFAAYSFGMVVDASMKYEAEVVDHERPACAKYWDEVVEKKLFTDSEFEIVGYEPKYTNQNEAQTNELGRTFRSSSKEGMKALETLGAIILKTDTGVTFS